MSNINSASRQIAGCGRRRHMIATPPPQSDGGIELTKCIFHLLLIDLLIPNNIHILSIYLSLPSSAPPPSAAALLLLLLGSSGRPFVTSISPSVTPSKQNESVYCGGGLPLTPFHSR